MCRSTALERLYECAAARSAAINPGSPLPPAAVEELKKLMVAVPLEELGFRSSAIKDPRSALPLPGSPRRAREGTTSAVTYIHIFENRHLTLGMFCFPEGACIPLHDHPGMTVLSRLLFGTLRVRSYDFAVEGAYPEVGDTVEVMFKANATVRAPASTPLVLFPTDGGNIHEFVAETPCAVLDLLVPPYCSGEARDCTYYEEAEPAARVPGDTGVLQAIEQPPWFTVLHADYTGVPIS
ncbi:hypothetical protein FOA52_007909 [Chlamydomonas sp. UWO 241]|nr:hypothetical protein FOA52_007909 [Chlamydomonas sp. UWO 241]